jgi:hypothetical protein
MSQVAPAFNRSLHLPDGAPTGGCDATVYHGSCLIRLKVLCRMIRLSDRVYVALFDELNAAAVDECELRAT